MGLGQPLATFALVWAGLLVPSRLNFPIGRYNRIGPLRSRSFSLKISGKLSAPEARVRINHRGQSRGGSAGRGRGWGAVSESRILAEGPVDHQISLLPGIAEGLPAWGREYVEEGLREILEGRGFEGPTAVQESATGPIARGQSVVIQASTGSGKTLSYLAPLLSRYIRTFGKENHHQVQGLILTPSPELCVQIKSEILSLLKPQAASYPEPLLMTGVGSLLDQLESARSHPPDIVIATPKQVRAALEEEKGREMFQKVSWIVVDEADRVLKPLSKYASFREKKSRGRHANPCEVVINHLIQDHPEAQLCLVSATVNNPLRSMFRRNGWKVERISVGTPFEIPPQISHYYMDRHGVKMSDSIAGLYKSRIKGTTGKGALVFAMEHVHLPDFQMSLRSRGLEVEILHEVAQHDPTIRDDIVAKVGPFSARNGWSLDL
ncbi:hypothetical protein AAMO2058_001678300 [Amorphochlora amoebiformis]